MTQPAATKPISVIQLLLAGLFIESAILVFVFGMHPMGLESWRQAWPVAAAFLAVGVELSLAAAGHRPLTVRLLERRASAKAQSARGRPADGVPEAVGPNQNLTGYRQAGPCRTPLGSTRQAKRVRATRRSALRQ